MEIKKVSMVDEFEKFKVHIASENNYRILFSGIFGLGKTFFLNNFFSEFEDEYIYIKLNPVNYSVSTNEDIFELIKFDIGYQLLSKKPDFNKEAFSPLLAGQMYILENYKFIIEKLIKNLSKLDKKADAIIASTLEIGKEIKKFVDDSKIDEQEELNKFLSFFPAQKGTYREENRITELLVSLIESLKINNPEKQIVLLIDDLDRIDPEHIFRIFNIFSAHFDYYDIENENKFGFDKIILVCDVDNIRGIFNHKYGTDIDFSGYIDKFYSQEIFYYRIDSIIKRNLDAYISEMSKGDQYILRNLRGETFIRKELNFLITHFVYSNALSFRSLLNFFSKDLKVNDYNLQSNIFQVHSRSTPVLIIFEILETVFGGKYNLIKAFEKVSTIYPNFEFSPIIGYSSQRLGNLIMLLDYSNSNLAPSNTDNYVFKSKELNIKAEYQIKFSSTDTGVQGSIVDIGSFKENLQSGISPVTKYSRSVFPYFKMYQSAFIAKNEIIRIQD